MILKYKISHIFAFLKVISLTKIINSIKLRISFLLSIFLKKVFIYGYPESISIEPVNYCNLNCPECPAGTKNLNRTKQNIDFQLFKEIITDSSKYIYNLILYFQGEPFLSNDLIKQIEFTISKNIYVSTSTNGHFLNIENCQKIVKSRLNKIIISLDGIDQESYEKYRIGGDFNKVVSGIKNLIQARNELHSFKPYIVVQFLVFKHNQNQINRIRELTKALKVDKLEIKTAQILYNKSELPDIEKFSRYKKNGNKLLIKSKLTNRCKRMWNSVVFTSNGNISPCCFDKEGKYNYGNYNKIKFKEIRKSNNYKQFAKSILINRKYIDICNNCTEGLKI